MFLGNGEIGAMIWAIGHPLKITLDKCDLWEERTAEEMQYGSTHTWEDMQRLIHKQDITTLHNKYEFPLKPSSSEVRPLQPTRLPLPRIELDFEHPLEDWGMTLDLYDAQIRGTFTHDSDYIVMRGFIHANENLLLLEFGDASVPLQNVKINVNFDNLEESAIKTLQSWGT